MTAYLIRRLIFGVVLIFLSTIISFTILKLSPGKAGPDEFNPRLSREYIEAQRRLFGLDRHPVRQYLDWLGVSWLFDHKPDNRGILQGDLGKSIKYFQPVSKVITSRIWATLSLNLVTLVFVWLVAVPLGIYAAVHYQKLSDKLLSGLSFAGMSLPGFFMALMLLWLFAARLEWIPPGGLRSLAHETYRQRMLEIDRIHDEASAAGRGVTNEEQARIDSLRKDADENLARLGAFGRLGDYAKHMILPVVVLTFGALASLQRVMRGNMVETLRQQYVTTARAKGLPENKVIYKHALRNAINPLFTLFGFEFAYLFGGAAILENVINFPGMGQLILEALRAKDQSVVMASFLIGSFMLVLGNLLADVMLAWVDPRVSYA